MPSQPNFKTADWTGIVRPHLADENELTALSIRLPKELADDVALAAKKYRRWFDSEEFIATAVSWALRSLVEDPPPIRRRPKHLRQKRNDNPQVQRKKANRVDPTKPRLRVR